MMKMCSVLFERTQNIVIMCLNITDLLLFFFCVVICNYLPLEFEA